MQLEISPRLLVTMHKLSKKGDSFKECSVKVVAFGFVGDATFDTGNFKMHFRNKRCSPDKLIEIQKT